MTTTFGCNADNDIYIGLDTNLVILQGIPAISQACEHAAKARLGEMVLAVDNGIPYFETVWNGVPNLQQFQIALRKAFLQIADVSEIVSLTTGQVGNTLNYNAVIRTTTGNEVTING